MSRHPGAGRPPGEMGRSDEARGAPSAWLLFNAPLDPDRPPISGRVRYGATLGALALTMAALWPVRDSVGLLNIGLVFLIVVIGATVWAGRSAGILASVLGFFLFDFFLVPPYLTFIVGDLHNILALFVFLGVSALLSGLIAGAQEQAREATRRAEDMSRLYELNQAIIGSQQIDQVLPAIASRVAAVFAVQVCWIFLPDAGRQLSVRAQAPSRARAPHRAELAMAAVGLCRTAARWPTVKTPRHPDDQAGPAAGCLLTAAHRAGGALACSRWPIRATADPSPRPSAPCSPPSPGRRRRPWSGSNSYAKLSGPRCWPAPTN